mgnify:CR=1 FL=1
MNGFKQWFEQELHSAGLKKVQLIKQIGYQNSSKGLRRLTEFLDQPHKSHNEFIRVISIKLNLELSELREQAAKRKQQLVEHREPFIQLTYHNLKHVRPLFHRGWLSSLLREEVPEIIQRLPLEEREKQLSLLYKKKLASLDDDLSRQITGFTYHAM